MSVNASNSERAMGFSPFKDVDVVSLKNEVEVLKTQARVAAEEIVEIFSPYTQPILENATYAIGQIGELGARALSVGKGRAITVLLVLETALAACTAYIPTATERNFDPKTLPDGGGVATEVVGIEVTPTLNPEGLMGKPVKLELVNDAEVQTKEAKEFSEARLIFQKLTFDENNQVVGVSEEVVEKPGANNQFLVESVFNVIGDDQAVKDVFVKIKTYGQEYVAIKLVNSDTNNPEYVVLQDGKPVHIGGGNEAYLPSVYVDVNADGSASQLFYPMAFEYNESGFTGKAIYGDDDGTYSNMNIGNYFTAKNAMLSPQMEATILETEKQLLNQGIEEYNVGIDPVNGGLMFVDGEGNALVRKDGKWIVGSAEIDMGVTPISETELIVETLNGVETKVKVIVDETLDSSTTRKLTLNPNFTNVHGLNAEQSMAEFAQKSVYDIWVRNGNTGTYEDYLKNWSIAQQTGNPVDWDKVAVEMKLNDPATPEYDAAKQKLYPMWVNRGIPVPAGVDVFSELDVVVSKLKASNVDKTVVATFNGVDGKMGFGTSLSPDKKLYANVAISGGGPNDGTVLPVAWRTSLWSYFAATGQGSDSYNVPNILETFAIKVSNNRYKSALQVWGAGDTRVDKEKQSNP